MLHWAEILPRAQQAGRSLPCPSIFRRPLHTTASRNWSTRVPCTFLGLWLPVWASWVAMNVVETASGISPHSRPKSNSHCWAAEARQWICEWLAGHCFEDLGVVSRSLPGTMDLTTPTAFTSVLLRNISDFKHCEISPCSEDTPVRICLRWTQEAMLYALEIPPEGEGEIWTLPDAYMGGWYSIIIIFCAFLKIFIINSSGIK